MQRTVGWFQREHFPTLEIKEKGKGKLERPAFAIELLLLEEY
jgi:hypothetical protein